MSNDLKNGMTAEKNWGSQPLQMHDCFLYINEDPFTNSF